MPVPDTPLITSLVNVSKSCKPATFPNSWSTTVDRSIRSNACGSTADNCRVPPDVPLLVNLRLDPFVRTTWPNGNVGFYQYFDWFRFEFWRLCSSNSRWANSP